jgi:hypothetical protein
MSSDNAWTFANENGDFSNGNFTKEEARHYLWHLGEAGGEEPDGIDAHIRKVALKDGKYEEAYSGYAFLRKSGLSPDELRKLT